MDHLIIQAPLDYSTPGKENNAIVRILTTTGGLPDL